MKSRDLRVTSRGGQRIREMGRFLPLVMVILNVLQCDNVTKEGVGGRWN